ncbi:MAG TPA: hypothetical protein VJ083_01430, partial [Sedimentibacter sp.]|nr:hypothetical protein [Sedimentibacter sp.]
KASKHKHLIIYYDMILTIIKDKYAKLSNLIEYFQNLPNGRYKVEITKMRNSRTIQQNKWLWGVVYEQILQGLICVGYDEFTSKEEVHEYCKSVFTSDSKINKHTGEIITFPTSTKDMNTVEFVTYVDLLRDWASEYLNIDIPDPTKELNI